MRSKIPKIVVFGTSEIPSSLILAGNCEIAELQNSTLNFDGKMENLEIAKLGISNFKFSILHFL